MTVQAELGFVDRIECLPPLPAIVQRVLSVTESPNSSAQDVAKVLGHDPGVAAKVLRVANSPFYGVSREITQVSRAVVTLGTRAVRNLVLGICARHALMAAAQQAPEHARLWQHAIAVATAGELIARQVGFKPSEEGLVAGLLHDVGQLAMATFEPEVFRTVVSDYVPESRRLELERECFRIDHAEAGFRILSRWGLPEPLCRVARCHHAPNTPLESESDRLVAIVVLANAIAHIAGFGLDTPVGDPVGLDQAAKLLGLTESEQARVFATLERRVEDATEALAPGGDSESDSAPPPRQSLAVWVTAAANGDGHMCQSLLERSGYQVRCMSPVDCSRDCPADDLVVIECDSADQNPFTELAAKLARQGHHKIVLVRDPGEGAPLRKYDPATGVCCIPRVFTAFDLKWAEELLRS